MELPQPGSGHPKDLSRCQGLWCGTTAVPRCWWKFPRGFWGHVFHVFFFLLVGGCGVSLATRKWGSQFWEFLVDMMWDRYWRRLFFIWSFIQQDCPQYLAASRSSAKSEILDCLDGHCDEFPTTFGLFRKMALLQSEFSAKLSTIHSAKFTSQDELLKNLRRIGSSPAMIGKFHPRSCPSSSPLKNDAWKSSLSFWDMAYFQGRTQGAPLELKQPRSCMQTGNHCLFLFFYPGGNKNIPQTIHQWSDPNKNTLQ